jgi:F-type H+-transporting ATPase subunit delta
MALGREERVAKRYARALFDVSAPTDFERVDAQLQALAAIWKESADLRQGMNNPRVSDEVRLSIIDSVAQQVLGGWATESAKKTVRLIVSRRKASVLPSVAAVFSLLVSEYKKSLSLEITLATPANDDVVASMKGALSRELGGEVSLSVKSDPALLGGATIRLGDRLLDRSVAGTLQRIASQLVR